MQNEQGSKSIKGWNVIKRSSNNTNVFYGIGWLLVAVLAWLQYSMGDGSDKSWLLFSAGQLLDGKILYKDVFETNPPLVIWLFTLPVVLSRMSGIADYHVLSLLTIFLVATVVWISVRLLRFHPAFESSRRCQNFHMLLLAAILIYWPNTLYFADRDYLFVVCVFPYMLRCMPSLSRVVLPRYLSVTVGALAALGFCIKPHCLALFIIVQCLVLIKERSLRNLFRLENWLVGFAWALYVLVIYSLVPEYYHTILPMALAAYVGYKNTITSIFFYVPAFLSFIIAYSEFRPRYKTPYRTDIIYILGLCLAGYFYAQISNGWLYSLYLMNSVILLAIGWVWFEYAWLRKTAEEQGQDSRNFRNGIYACWVVLVFNIAGTLIPYTVMLSQEKEPITKDMRVMEALQGVIREHHITSFGSMASSAGPWPLLARDLPVKFVTRFNMLWMMPAFITSDDAYRQKNAWIIDYVVRAYAQDLTQNKPEIMFVDTSPQYGFTNKKLDLLAMFSAYPEFVEAWKSYSFLQRISFCDVIDEAWNQKIPARCQYDVFRRNP